MSSVGSDGSTESAEGGNTKTPSSVRISPAIRWCFTLNNWTNEEYGSIVECFCDKCKKYIIGSEHECEGTPHLQGYCEFKTKVRALSLGLSKRIHWEKSKGSLEDNIKYCSKEKVLISAGMPKPIKVITELFRWQKYLENLYLEEPDDRTIYWIWDADGNSGKSAFIKYMIVKYKILFCSGGKYSDIMNLIFNQNMDECNCVMFDIPRANQGNISYSSLESIKNGMVCNTKYETGVKIFNSPHVFCFANFPPSDESMLSKDRWIIKNLNELYSM